MSILEKNPLKQEKTQNTVFCYFKVNEICYHAAPLFLSVPITQYDLVGVILLLQVQIIIFLQVQMHVVFEHISLLYSKDNFNKEPGVLILLCLDYNNKSWLLSHENMKISHSGKKQKMQHIGEKYIKKFWPSCSEI